MVRRRRRQRLVPRSLLLLAAAAATTAAAPSLPLLLLGAGPPSRGFVGITAASPGRLPKATGAAAVEGEGGDADVDSLLREAQRLREQAEAEQEMLQAKKRLREAQEEEQQAQQTQQPLADLEQELVATSEKLEVAKTKLSRAEAFKLPEMEGLQKEVAALAARSEQLQTELQAKKEPPAAEPSSPTTPTKRVRTNLKRDGKELTEADWEDLGRVFDSMAWDKRVELGQALGPEGREKLSEVMKRQEEEKESKKNQDSTD